MKIDFLLLAGLVLPNPNNRARSLDAQQCHLRLSKTSIGDVIFATEKKDFRSSNYLNELVCSNRRSAISFPTTGCSGSRTFSQDSWGKQLSDWSGCRCHWFRSNVIYCEIIHYFEGHLNVFRAAAFESDTVDQVMKLSFNVFVWLNSHVDRERELKVKENNLDKGRSAIAIHTSVELSC